ncbi:hypothetical protein KWH75_06605 [Morganella morganii]|uniref:hypothetical protein n=1 Tax=Morganella morganii TaxID=582 RepID=UPI0021D3A7B6|nr:hypothetical protein [Morganella morganii]MCU6236738.1 hypothetical protein [Morganella morganii]
MTSGNKLNLGKLGEDTFSLWCTEAELVSNRSHDEDATGWDHLVEFPYIESDKPKDTWGAPVECKVQVKSTQRKDRRLSIKSSVLKRLIDYSYPAFILFLEFNKQNKLENSFLVHVDKKITEKVLKEIRKNSISSTQKELHKLKISINYDEKNILPENTGVSFREAIFSFIPDFDINKYQDNKRKINKQSGYDDFYCQIQFTATPNKLREHIYQSIVRGNERLEVNDFKISENRFNLPDGDVTILRPTSGWLIITPNVISNCLLYFKKTLTSPAITFNAEVFLLPKLSIDENDCIILRSSVFSIKVMSKNKKLAKCEITLIRDKQAGISEIIKTLKVIQLYEINGEIVLGFDLNGFIQAPVKMINSNINNKILILINPLEKISNHFNLDINSLTTLEYLVEKYAIILSISKIISNDIKEVKFSNKTITDEDILVLEIPFINYVEFENNIIGASCIIVTKKDDDGSFIATNFNEVDSFSFTSKEQLTNYIENLNSKLKNDSIYNIEP